MPVEMWKPFICKWYWKENGERRIPVPTQTATYEQHYFKINGEYKPTVLLCRRSVRRGRCPAPFLEEPVFPATEPDPFPAKPAFIKTKMDGEQCEVSPTPKGDSGTSS